MFIFYKPIYSLILLFVFLLCLILSQDCRYLWFKKNINKIINLKICQNIIGNINNPLTLLFKGLEDVRREVAYAIDCGVDIIGPECAVPLTTPLENLKEISRVTKSFKL